MRIRKARQSSSLILPSRKVNRRSFFSFLGMGIASIIAAPSIIAKVASIEPALPFTVTIPPVYLNDIEMYNRLPFYLAKMQVERAKGWNDYVTLLEKREWKPNMGNVMRSVK